MAKKFYDLAISSPLGGGKPAMVDASLGTDVTSTGIISAGPTSSDWATYTPVSGSPEIIVERAYRVETASTRTTDVRFYTDGTHRNIEYLLKMKRLTSQASGVSTYGGGGLVLRASATNTDGYYISLGAMTSAHVRKLSISKLSGSTSTSLGTSTTMPATTDFATGDVFRRALFLRVQAESGVIKARAWWENVDEPSTWLTATSDTTFANGRTVVECGGYGLITDLMFLSYDDGTTPSAPFVINNKDDIVANRRRLTARVFGYAGQPGNMCKTPLVGATARLYHRDTGYLLDETTADTQGNFNLYSSTTGDITGPSDDLQRNLCNIIVLDNNFPYRSTGSPLWQGMTRVNNMPDALAGALDN